MPDTSDGEGTNRHFKNVENIDTTAKIKTSVAFGKLCNSIVNNNGKILNIATDEFKRKLNGEQFKKGLQIPKSTVIEVNFVAPNLVILFAYRAKSMEHVLRIRLDNDTLTKANEFYMKKLAETEEKVRQTNADKSKQNSQPTDVNLATLIKKVEDLTNQLARETIENQRLKQMILDLKSNGTSKSDAEESKRKRIRGNNTPQSSNIRNDSVERIEVDASSEDSASDSTLSTTNKKKKKQQNKQNSTDVTCAHSDQAVKPNSKRNKHIPPIVVFDTNQKRMNERILSKNICARNEYYFVRVNKSKYRINVSNITQYDGTIALLNELGIKYHTYTPPERKPIHVLIKNVPTCYDETEILEFLNKDHGLIPLRLTKFVTKYMLANNIQSTILHASFDPKTDKSCIFNVKHIGNQYGIVVEAIKNKSITQCRRCWRFEHTQTNCTYDPRCPHCLLSHTFGNCALDKNGALKPACVNCKAESHSATAKECPVYARILERKNKPGNKTNKHPKPTVNVDQTDKSAQQNTGKNGTYANVLRPKSTQNQQHQTPIGEDLREFMKELAIQQIQLNKMFMDIAPRLFGPN